MNFIELHCVIEYQPTLLCFKIITTATFSNLQNVLLYLSVCFTVFKYFKRIIINYISHNHPRFNQADVVHASWKNRDETGLSLYQAAEFDTRDSILSEAEPVKVMHTTKEKECGPILTEISER